MSGAEYQPPVDEPPGKDGHQGAGSNQENAEAAVPEWAPGTNPPGTNPPVPTPDAGKVPLPGMIPGVVVDAEPETEPPANVDAPYLSQAGETLTCTMGNWDNEPTSYVYEWFIDGGASSASGHTYTALPEDVGKIATCVVTATNAVGSTTAPPSNEVVIA